tara:strand:+ start:4963 stop:5214 length:252 start_codon:yes stop_codon:yes gene_type:complete
MNLDGWIFWLSFFGNVIAFPIIFLWQQRFQSLQSEFDIYRAERNAEDAIFQRNAWQSAHRYAASAQKQRIDQMIAALKGSENG